MKIILHLREDSDARQIDVIALARVAYGAMVNGMVDEPAGTHWGMTLAGEVYSVTRGKSAITVHPPADPAPATGSEA